MSRWWDAEKVVTQLRFRLLKEEDTIRLRQFLADPGFSQALLEQLEVTALHASCDVAKAQLQQWLLQQQQQRRFQQAGQALPAQRLWHFLHPFLEKVGLSSEEQPRPFIPSPATPLAQAPATPLFRLEQNAIPSTTPPEPNHHNLPQPALVVRTSPQIPTIHNVPTMTPMPNFADRIPGTPLPTKPRTHGTPLPIEQTTTTPYPSKGWHTPLPKKKEKKGLPSFSSLSAIQEKQELSSETHHGSDPVGNQSSHSKFSLPVAQQAPLHEFSVMPDTGPRVPWDVSGVLSQFRLVLLKDKTAGPLRNVFGDVSFFDDFQEALHRANILPTESAAQEYVHHWLLQQQRLPGRSLPVQRFWQMFSSHLQHMASRGSLSSQYEIPRLPQSAVSVEFTPQPKWEDKWEDNTLSNPQPSTSAENHATPNNHKLPIPHHKRMLRQRRTASQEISLQSLEAPNPTTASEAKNPTPMPVSSAPQPPHVVPSSSLRVPSSGQHQDRVRGGITQRTSIHPQPPPTTLPVQETTSWTQEFELLFDQADPAHPATNPEDGVVLWQLDQPNVPQQTSHPALSGESPSSRIRLYLLLGLALLTILFSLYFHTASRPTVEGIQTDMEIYKKHLPVSAAFRKKDTLALVLHTTWKKQTNIARLERQILILHQTFRKQGIARLKVFTPKNQLLFSINLEVQF